MLKHLFLVINLCLIISLSCSRTQKTDERGYIVRTGEMAPDFVINEADGRSYKLSDLKGNVVMLQFTASWCSVCRQEMPFIESEIWQPGKKLGLVVIGIDRDEPVETVLEFQKKISVTYPLALDPGAEIFGLFADGEAGVTRNVIIDRNGRIIFMTRLFDQMEFDEMKTLIFNLLSGD